MERRSVFKQALVLGMMAVLPSLAMAQAKLTPGKDYQDIKPPQRTDSGNKIEVIEFFSYGCPHCNDFEPYIESWTKRQPADVVVRRIPITFNREPWAVLAKVFITLESLGVSDRLNPLVFKAVHVDRVDFGDEAGRNAWMQKNGVDAAKFAETYKSFSVQSKLTRATQIAAAYQIQGVPTLAIDGRYLTSPSMNESFEGTLAATDQLVAQARKQRGK
ncbi:thiol:disulfide interchange protein DsbA/DsbL [Niveibacterium sp. SC-1]|uniref:thiol:disulfide interchange protein DsbA/DsbL n=1 Tax=Niveibacterium sp. SC-1 TaxID=3135646 RepID=UPI00311DD301